MGNVTQYRIDHELGRGGMAVVYAALDEKLDRPVALKVLAAHLADQPEFRARFLREARIAARLSHPNLVRTFDIAELDGPARASSWSCCPAERSTAGRLTRAEAAQVAAGLAYAHALGVVHRDLKPANMLRGSDGEREDRRLRDRARGRGDDADRRSGPCSGRSAISLPSKRPGAPSGRRRTFSRSASCSTSCLRTDARRPRAARALPVDRAALTADRSRGRRCARGRDACRAHPRARAHAQTTEQSRSGRRCPRAGRCGRRSGRRRLSQRGHTTRIEPVPHATYDGRSQAHELSAWLRRHSRYRSAR